MSYSTHKAIAGMQAAEESVRARCLEAIEKYAAVRTEADLQAILSWAKQHDWFLMSEGDARAMHAAHRAARQRIANACEAQFPKLSRPAQRKATETVAFLRTEQPRIRGLVGVLLAGNGDAVAAPPIRIAQWIDPTSRANTAAFFLQAAVSMALGFDGAIARAAYKALSSDEQDALTAMINAAVEEGRAGFYEAFPQFRPGTTP